MLLWTSIKVAESNLVLVTQSNALKVIIHSILLDVQSISKIKHTVSIKNFQKIINAKWYGATQIENYLWKALIILELVYCPYETIPWEQTSKNTDQERHQKPEVRTHVGHWKLTESESCTTSLHTKSTKHETVWLSILNSPHPLPILLTI